MGWRSLCAIGWRRLLGEVRRRFTLLRPTLGAMKLRLRWGTRFCGGSLAGGGGELGGEGVEGEGA